MGLFSKRTSSQSRNQGSNSRQSTIQHLADWGHNGAMFFVNADGVSWSYKKECRHNDETLTQAAKAQLERAYHMNVTYPDAEERVIAYWRAVSDEQIPAGTVPHFDWQPPLPGN